MNYILDAFKKSLDFKDRARRKEYWFFILFYILVFSVLAAIDEAIGTMFQLLPGEEKSGILSMVFYVACLPTILSVSIRRLHDTNHSGWWLLVPLIPIIFLFQDSQKGANRFGENPKGINA